MTAERLYTISSIYIAGSIFWWFVFRRFKAVYVLSAPFLFYGAAFLLVGVSGLLGVGSSREWLGNVGTGLYSFASASGSLYFALNFGDEGGAPVKDWVFRACLIQGTQQSYVIALWYWGQQLTANNQAGTLRNGPNIVSSSIIIPVGILFWVIGGLLAYGLPVYYRGLPGGIPHFYAAVARRNIVKWFFVAVILQNYWLSAPYGRNWSYLWSSTHAPAWAIGMLIILFFGILWAASLFAFAKLTKQHSWLLPVFAIGLGAPRWCQMLWSTSNIGIYLPWAGGPVASALMGRSLWLWLGVLDAIQGLGLGMILLQTLTRMHVAFTLLGAQVLGSLATIAARATAPDNIGPGNVFPDWSGWRWGDSAAEAGLGWEFWLGLGCQVLVCAGYLLFFRKEQLTKP